MRSRELKVLHVCTFDQAGGAAVAAYRLHRAMLQRGIYSRFLVLKKTSDDSTVLMSSSKLGLFSNRVINYLCRGALRFIGSPKEVPASLNIVRNFSIDVQSEMGEYDIVNLHWIGSNCLSISQIARINRPVVWTLHDTWPVAGLFNYPPKYFFSSLSFKSNWLLNSVDVFLRKQKQELVSKKRIKVVCPSNWMKHVALDGGVDDNNVYIIPNCMGEAEKIYKQKDRESINCSGKKVVLFGAVNATSDLRKGFDLLSEAMRIVQEACSDQSIQFVVFGSDLDVEIDGVEVLNVGKIDGDNKLVELYQRSHVFVLSSRLDNLPNTVVEALHCGVPVVAFKAGGNSDLVRHLENGYLADAYNTADLANGVLWALNTVEQNPNICKRISQNASNRYSNDLIVQKYVDCYWDAIEESKT